MTKHDVLHSFTRGDPDATRFLTMVTDIAHVWDDLIDLDVPVDPQAVHNAFFDALVVLPRNPFYARHFEMLNPILIAAINNWRVANTLEAGDDEADHRIAFISRSSYIDLITQVAFLIGGHEWVREVGPAIRRFVHAEGWEQYQANLKAEKAARAARTQGA